MVVTGRKEMMLLPMSLHKRQNFSITFSMKWRKLNSQHNDKYALLVTSLS